MTVIRQFLKRSIVYSNSWLTSSIKSSFQISTVTFRDTLFIQSQDYVTLWKLYYESDVLLDYKQISYKMETS